MNDEHFHDIVMIWLLRRLDLGAAKHEMLHAYGDLFESGELKDMSKDDLTMYMLEILDRYELPHTIKCAEDFKFLHYVPF